MCTLSFHDSFAHRHEYGQKTSAAANMLSAFEPIMSQAQVDKVKSNLEKIKAMTQDLAPMMSEQNITQLKGYMQLLSQVASETDKMMSMMAEMGISKQMLLLNSEFRIKRISELEGDLDPSQLKRMN